MGNNWPRPEARSLQRNVGKNPKIHVSDASRDKFWCVIWLQSNWWCTSELDMGLFENKLPQNLDRQSANLHFPHQSCQLEGIAYTRCSEKSICIKIIYNDIYIYVYIYYIHNIHNIHIYTYVCIHTYTYMYYIHIYYIYIIYIIYILCIYMFTPLALGSWHGIQLAVRWGVWKRPMRRPFTNGEWVHKPRNGRLTLYVQY